MAKITDTQPEDWAYVSEGGATIVFSYRGPPNPTFDGTVLRLRKALVPVPSAQPTSGARQHANSQEVEEPDDPTIEYQTKCMSRLIPSQFLPRLETVRLDEPWLEKLVELQNRHRPEIRREKDMIDLDRQKGVLATDLVGGKWIAVEIKVSSGTLICCARHRSKPQNKTIFSLNGRFCRTRPTYPKRLNLSRVKLADSACITAFATLKEPSWR